MQRLKRKRPSFESSPSRSTSFIECYGTETSESNGNSTILTAFGSALPSTRDLNELKDSVTPYYDINSSYQDIYAVTNLSTFGRGLQLKNFDESIQEESNKSTRIFPRTNPNFRNVNSKSSSMISYSDSLDNSNQKCQDYLRKQCY